MISGLLEEEVPFDPTVALGLLEEVGDLATATGMDDQGLSQLPMELQVGATFIRDTVDYLLTGVEEVTLEDFMDQVSLQVQNDLVYELSILDIKNCFLL